MHNITILTPFVGCAVVLYHVLKNKDNNAKVIFTDNNTRLQGKMYGDAEIISADEARKLYPGAKVVICSPQYVSVIKTQYSNAGFKDIETDCGNLINKEEALSVIDLINQKQILSINSDLANDLTNFFGYINYFLTSSKIKNTHALVIDVVNISISQRCSLRCRDCVANMQYYQNPVDYSLETNIKTFDSFMQRVDFVKDIGIFGGEPFLYGGLAEFIMHTKSQMFADKIGRMTISTNATVIPDKRTREALKSANMLVYIANYGNYSKKINELVAILKADDIFFKLLYEHEWYPVCKIIDGEAVSDSAVWERFAECEVLCRYLQNGKFFYCSFLGAAYNLKAVPENAENYIDLMDESVSKEDIRHYLAVAGGYSGCRWCSGYNFRREPIEKAIQTKIPLPYKKYE
jgi:organic radical activating enzyme